MLIKFLNLNFSTIFLDFLLYIMKTHSHFTIWMLQQDFCGRVTELKLSRAVRGSRFLKTPTLGVRLKNTSKASKLKLKIVSYLVYMNNISKIQQDRTRTFVRISVNNFCYPPIFQDLTKKEIFKVDFDQLKFKISTFALRPFR